jgi:putative membrane protein
MMWNNSQWGGLGMVLGPVFMVLIVVGIVAGIIYLLRLLGAAGNAGSPLAHDRALVLLKERYAKGEIDSEEFAERKKLLTDCARSCSFKRRPEVEADSSSNTRMLV